MAVSVYSYTIYHSPNAYLGTVLLRRARSTPAQSREWTPGASAATVRRRVNCHRNLPLHDTCRLLTTSLSV
jgi:hypothetical protein